MKWFNLFCVLFCASAALFFALTGNTLFAIAEVLLVGINLKLFLTSISNEVD